MAFRLKPVLGEEQTMELAQIHQALRSGTITEQWLVREERQDFWYSVAKLIGKVESNPIALVCPRCQSPITARRIDIGLPVACPRCGAEAIVIDPEALKRRVRDRGRLVDLRKRTILSGLALVGGLTVTIGSHVASEGGGGMILPWGLLAFGIGTFSVCLPQYLALKRALGEPPK
jgi:Zn finger protein HypA/HybF involved in hydrogenase expression